MEKRFIEINGIMLDYEQYREEAMLLKEYIKSGMKEYLENFEFEFVSKTCKKRRAVLKFYNKRLDLEIKIDFKKKSNVKFV